MTKLNKIASAPGRLVRKAWNLLTLHTSRFFSVMISAVWGDRTYEGLKESTFASPFGFRAYHLVSTTCAQLPIWAQYEVIEEGEAKLKEDPDHPFLDILRRPNMQRSWMSFVADIIDHLWFDGNLYFYAPETPLTGSQAGVPRPLATGGQGLQLLHPSKLARIEYNDQDEPTRYYYRRRNGTLETIPAARVFHTFLFRHPADPDRGWPLAAAAHRAAELIREGEEWNKAHFAAKGRPPGFFKYTGDGAFTDERYRQAKISIQEGYKRDAETGLPGLLAGDYDWIPNAVSQKDADWLGSEQQAARKIAIGLGVMTPLLGDAQNMTFDNLKTSVRALLLLHSIPLMEWLLDEFNARYMSAYEGESILAINHDDVDALQEDANERYHRLREASGRPFLSVDEARQETGFKSTGRPEDAELWVQVGLMPAEQAAVPMGGFGEVDAEIEAAERALRKLLERTNGAH